jgi:hypothetical protein
MRPLFTDGWNSFWHVVFGILGSKYSLILISFLVYQVVTHDPLSRSFAGILEFVVGFMLNMALNIV